MILFYRPKKNREEFGKDKTIASGLSIGPLAGYIPGLLGVGGNSSKGSLLLARWITWA